MDADAKASPRWTFRHDKIMDFFLMYAFTGASKRIYAVMATTGIIWAHAARRAYADIMTKS